MISAIMAYLNNHFVISNESSNSFAIVTDGITGVFNQTYLVGQYVWIKGSVLNDGVYKITAVSSTKLTLDATLLAEDTNDIIVYGCAPSSEFLSLVTDITTWVSNYGGKEGLNSETIDSYSYSFAGGASGVENTWQKAFSSRLSSYRKVFEDCGVSKAYYRSR